MHPQDTQLQPSHTAAVYRRIATLFFALTAGVVFLAVYVIFARAEVVILSEQEAVNADVIVDVARVPGQGEVRGDVFEDTETITETFPSASIVGVDQPAQGRVRITSRLSRSQTLVATTRLLTEDETLFRIKDTVTVPAGGSVEVDAFATEAGVKGQVSDGTAFTIPGLNGDLRRQFSTVAVGAFTSDRKDLRMITQSDIDKAAEVLHEKATSAITARLRERAATSGASVDGELVITAESGRSTDAVVGDDKPEFSVTVSVAAVAVFYDKSGFDAAVRERLSGKTMDGRHLVSIGESGGLRLEKRDLAAGRANVGLTASGVSVLSSSAQGLEPTKLTGITVDAAEAYLQTVEGVASASIKTRPFWVGRMPNAADRITVEVR